MKSWYYGWLAQVIQDVLRVNIWSYIFRICFNLTDDVSRISWLSWQIFEISSRFQEHSFSNKNNKVLHTLITFYFIYFIHLKQALNVSVAQGRIAELGKVKKESVLIRGNWDKFLTFFRIWGTYFWRHLTNILGWTFYQWFFLSFCLLFMK